MNTRHLEKNKWFYLVVAVLVFIGYWFIVRPSYAKRYCAEKALGYAGRYTSSTYNSYYSKCLYEKGI